ncbi:uncharacterized protein LOC114739760 [Neltuma alba]|uniref:uncharacterized protein LOC114739760 n=1 Tax=Neltuma alba TaxID=207710 RepID=UPI0010A4AEAE|nr:uncharacterized protein LOC114739760 [Prosopis alba]
MRTSSLISLIFLLFALSTQHLKTLADSEQVLDFYGNALVPGKLYHILDFTDHAHGIQTEELDDQTCPITVIFGADAKKVIFTPKDEKATSIVTEQDLDIKFLEVSRCAKSGNWAVQVDADKNNHLLIGPPTGVETWDGSFHIRKSKTGTAYNLAFYLFERDDTFLVTRNYRPNQDIYRLELCTDEGFDVVFYPYTPATLTPPSVSRIRKRVA